MKKYVLDTSLYVHAFRSVPGEEALLRFYAGFAPLTYISSVVVHELLIGASTPAKERQIRDIVARPFRRTRRMLTPTGAAWEEAATAIARSTKRLHRDFRTMPKSLVNDFLLAASCRESGVTLITENVNDFEMISRYIGLSFEPAWPSQ